MNKIKVFEAFAGIGTQRMALERLKIPYESVGISEIDKYALQSYEAIHGDPHNCGDISKIKIQDIPDMDLFTYSFPCQDISLSGETKGLSEGSGTRSSLLWECRRVIEGKKPRYLLMENVKNLVGKRFKPDFDKWLEWLESQGYTNYWQVLNAKKYDIPQNRERVFVVSIYGDHKPFEFPEEIPLNIKLKDILEDNVDSKYFLADNLQKSLLIDPNQIPDREKADKPLDTVFVSEATKKGYATANFGDSVNLEQSKSKTRRGRVGKGVAQTINSIPQQYVIPKGVAMRGRYGADGKTTQKIEIRKDEVSNALTTVRKDSLILEELKLRKLTPLECWRLMGCLDTDFYKAKQAGVSDTRLYKQAGNAIVVDVLMAIFSKLFLK